MSAKSKFIKIGLPILIIFLSVVAAKIMIAGRKAPAKIARVEGGALVEIMVAEKTDRVIKINSTGIVRPSQEVTIIPQVNGRVVAISEKLVSGGFFKKGEVLFEIETVDYELAQEKALATLAKREFELSSVESRAKIARLEWDRLKKGQKTQQNSLALYEPQLKDAQANLASARASLRQAEINLERTKIKAPFNCVIRSENLDQGQYVKSGSAVMVLAGTDAAEVVVPVSLDDLYWLEIPGPNHQSKGASADIVLQTGSSSFFWRGNIDRMLAEVDSQGRMARMAISIKDPYLLKKTGEEGQPALVIGSFVDVSFKGKMMKGVFALPRQALRDNNTIWIMGDDNLLKVNTVETVRLERREVFIDKGIEIGDQVILTNLTGAANGMKLRSASTGEGS